MSDSARHGAQQPHRFNPARAARLDDPGRFAYLPPADVVALLDLRAGASLVDFGAGTGTYAVEIARARPDIRILALDEQAAMLDLLRAKITTAGISGIEPISASQAQELRGRVDRILALNVLHELGDTALAELPSLLRPNGFALVIDWNGDVERPHGPPREHVYSVAQARTRLAGAGLRIRDTALFPYHYALTCFLSD
jgi:ubiquinone/menaquinone biosynthesis C-methylase UbiE